MTLTVVTVNPLLEVLRIQFYKFTVTV